MSRPLRAFIDHQALTNNLQRVRDAAPAASVMAVVKANAYGHGAVAVARTLLAGGADSLAVIGIDEALRLRAAGIEAPITLLQGFYHPSELVEIAHQRLDLVLHQATQLEALQAARPAPPIRVWIKLDTGMHRLGFAPERLAEVLARLARCPAVLPQPGLFSHLASADVPADPATTVQITRFQALSARYPTLPTSLANSAGILGWPSSHATSQAAKVDTAPAATAGDTVRPGIMLYGASPFASGGLSAAELGLLPVMHLQSELIAIQRLEKGAAVGYGGQWQCPQNMPVGLVACGYGDGYPRHAPSGTPVQVAGTRVPLIGRVSMDTVCVDLRGCPGAQPGAPVVLWGADPGIDEVATAAGTIAYEPLTQLTARVPLTHCNQLQTDQ
jgi:alanine racemase